MSGRGSMIPWHETAANVMYTYTHAHSHAGNLPYSATAQEVLDFLGLSKSAESAVELVCARDKPQRRLGFGFVSVPPDKVEQVLGHNGSSMGERKIRGGHVWQAAILNRFCVLDIRTYLHTYVGCVSGALFSSFMKVSL